MLDFVAFIAVVVVGALVVRFFPGVRWLRRLVTAALVVVVGCAALAVAEMVDGEVWLQWCVAAVIGGLLWLLVVPIANGGRKWFAIRAFAATGLLVLPAWWAVQMLTVREAVVSGSDERLSANVDIPALRVSLESQLDDHFLRVDAARSTTQPDSVADWLVIGAKKSRRWLVKKVVRSMLTPEGLRALAVDDDNEDSGCLRCEWNDRLRVESVSHWRWRVSGGWLVFSSDSLVRRAKLTDVRLSQATLDGVEAR